MNSAFTSLLDDGLTYSELLQKVQQNEAA
jgi:hypothetical protein